MTESKGPKVIKIVKLDPYVEKARSFKLLDEVKVIATNHRDGRDNPDRRILYLVKDRKGKYITLYNCEITIVE